MEVENAVATGAGVKSQVPRPRAFLTVDGVAPGPRCGHTLTSVPDLNKLILFGECDGSVEGAGGRIGARRRSARAESFPPTPTRPAGGATALEGSSQKNADGTNSNQGAAAASGAVSGERGGAACGACAPASPGARAHAPLATPEPCSPAAVAAAGTAWGRRQPPGL